jgi:hypothetical protein
VCKGLKNWVLIVVQDLCLRGLPEKRKVAINGDPTGI